MEYVQVDIIGLSTSPSSGGAYALVLGEMGGNRRLPIIIGAFEAQAIALELNKIQPTRPMTHDLLCDSLEAVEVRIKEVVIDELRDGTFYAKIRYVHHKAEGDLDSRPSDAVALAVRVDAPIYVSMQVMEDAGVPTGDEAAGTMVANDGDVEEERMMTPLERMERQLAVAIEREDYEKAAEIRDAIKRLQGESQEN